jgi:hypothetical protein
MCGERTGGGTWSARFASALFLRSSRTTSRCPFKEAMKRLVRPVCTIDCEIGPRQCMCRGEGLGKREQRRDSES